MKNFRINPSLIALVSVVLALSFSLNGETAFAAKKKKAAAPAQPAAPEQLDLPVPQSQLEIEQLPPVERKPLVLEFMASSWAPINMSEQSYLPNTSDLQSTSLPRLSFNFWTSGWVAGSTASGDPTVKLSPVYGLSFTQLQRSAELNFAEQAAPVQQSLNFFSARVGLAVEPINPWHSLRPFAVLALLPTLETAAMSAMSNGISQTLLPIELTGGAAIEIPWFEKELGFRDFALEAGFDATHGTFGPAFNGLGFMVGTKITM